MNDLIKPTPGRPDFPDDITAAWQRTLDAVANTFEVSAAVIMKVDPPQLEVFLSSQTSGNPFRKGDRFGLHTGLCCQRVMQQKSHLLVPGTLKEPEWEHNPAIPLGLTYYLGFPLMWPDGEPFGTLCLFDRRNNTQVTKFKCLFEALRDLIEKDIGLIANIRKHENLLSELQWNRYSLRKMVGERTTKLKKHKEMLANAQRIAHLGSWVWDLTAGGLAWSDEVYRIFGLGPQAFGGTFEEFLASIHPDDRQVVKDAVNQSLADPGKEYSVEHRVILPDGSERVVHERGEVLFGPDRNPVRMFGTVHDITVQKRSEEELKKAFDEIRRLKEQLEAENIYLREERELKEKLPANVGFSDPIKYVMYRVEQVARTSTTVLLTGETGTGKNLFARIIHDKSDRRNKTFIHVNCAGLPPNLIESELFGREKGAFTGSTGRQIGRFELAHNGTIFLDEIGELSLELQAKLLKVIETGEFERLGSPHAVKVDARIIASSNRDLEQETKKGRFRMDLFYRLNIFPITIPPLRERKEDLPLIAGFYTEKFSKSYHKNITRIPKNIMTALENYGWPGNVRELINVIERAVIVSDGPALRLAGQISPLSVGPVQENVSIGAEPGKTKSLDKVEREHMVRTLQETGWKIEGHKGAAQLLGIHPSTMRARMRKLGIRRPETG
jgi:formate hydrogenlyase transcriptional activator